MGRSHVLLLLSLAYMVVIPPEPVRVSVRADAVEPSRPLDVTVRIGERVQRHTEVAPGTLLDLGALPEGTRVSAAVHNVRGAGTVRVAVIADGCFRATGRCDTPGCTAQAQYVVQRGVCENK